ncbi:ABC transporter ATP-binding protein [Pradoshia eiseniae]|uniref:ABC transporter ATP-binding protein n=2 Tax=Pradoshia eiseniae TaxID=2064768 RepID=A0A2S7N1L2_9BACI|nr:ABC transporter ATP-binding protein [Pradoshia eiseniae]
MKMIRCEKLTKSYQGFPALKGISFSIDGPGCYGFIGSNGSGKTTAIRIMAGLAKATSGRIQIEGYDVERDQKNIAKLIGYLPQNPAYYDYMTGEEWMMLSGKLFGLSKTEIKLRTERLLKRCGIWEARKRKIGGYSGGMKQRLGLAQALINEPKLLLLDEPVSALDPMGRHQVLELIEELKRDHMIFMSSHILDDVEKTADHILILHKGQLLLSSAKQDLLKEYAGSAIKFQLLAPNQTIVEAVTSQTWAERIEASNTSYRVVVNDLEKAKAQLPLIIQEEAGVITDYRIEALSLQDIFFKVVNA